jgi:hypothetical protein
MNNKGDYMALRNSAYQERVYLDQLTEMHTALREFCTNLDLDVHGFGTDNWVQELECRRRDGFIPHSHNRGGFDVYDVLEIAHDSEDDDEGELIFHGLRIMYEGVDDRGIHTLCAYYCKWSEHDVYGIGRAKTIAEVEIRFRSTERMLAKLTKFAKECI